VSFEFFTRATRGAVQHNDNLFRFLMSFCLV
jgi:hypothetical protein